MRQRRRSTKHCRKPKDEQSKNQPPVAFGCFCRRRCRVRAVVSIRQMSYLRFVPSVSSLRHADYHGALALVAEAAPATGSQPFELPVVEGLLRLIPGQGAGYFEYSNGGYKAGACNTYYVDTPGCRPGIDWASGSLEDDLVNTWPLLESRVSRSELPLKLSDFL